MSTRRARIKAVTALPPRRKNVDAVIKKNQEEKEGFESGIKPTAERRRSLDKTPKNRRLSIDLAAEQKKNGFEARVSPTKRRLSVDKTVKEGFEAGTKPSKARRSSVHKATKQSSLVDKSPKTPYTSINRTPNRRISVEVTGQNQLPANKTKDTSSVESKNLINIPDKSSENPSKPDEKCGYSSNKILKGLLDAAERPPKYPHHFNSPYINTVTPPKGHGNVSIECKPSTSKEKEGKQNETMKPSVISFFASPRGTESQQRNSPIVRTPVIEVDLIAEKLIAPHKGPNSVNNELSYMEIHAADVNKKTNAEIEVIVEKIVSVNEIKKLEKEFGPKKKIIKPIKIIDEYIVKPIAETSTSTVMDGIVPLKPVSNAPKPLDLLKNEIISENAEVLFDPIVPLPSPSKVRPKLRPVPRLGPRRNSFQQGSASESEDENRRLLGRPATPATPVHSRQQQDSHTSHVAAQPIVPREVVRVRNDSVCSVVSQAPSASQTIAVGSPLREREKNHKTRREEMIARRNAKATRRRQLKVEREKLTMYDLIFYNPEANPIIPDQDEIKAKEANKKEDVERQAEAMKQANSKVESSPEAAPAAVPQIKLGPNGEIILDEQSLVVNQSDQRKIETSVVREGAWGGSSSRAYRRRPRTAEWTDAETVRFYRAIAAMGTDFTLMQPLFPSRTRRDLKLKFKKEERLNLAQVDMALRSRSEWDPTRLETEFTQERQAAEEAAKKAKERLLREKQEAKERERERKSLGVRKSRCSRFLGDSAMPKRPGQSNGTPSTLDEYVKSQRDRKRNRKRNNQQDFTSPNKVSISVSDPEPPFATLTVLNHQEKLRQIAKKPIPCTNMAVISKEIALPVMPPNIETGSLVVLSVNDPKSPSRKMLQTYIAQGPGNLVPVSLPSNFLNSVVGVMGKTNSPTPTVVSPSVSLEISSAPNIISPRKRKSSYTITQL